MACNRCVCKIRATSVPDPRKHRTKTADDSLARLIDNSVQNRYTNQWGRSQNFHSAHSFAIRLSRPFIDSETPSLSLRLLVENLHLIRNERSLFQSLSFSLGAGDALVLAGANGAGKSSLLRALLGLLPLAHGSITLTGRDTPLVENAHLLGTADGLKAALSAGENLTFWSRVLRADDGSPLVSPAQALAQVNLAALEHTPVAYLSAGQRRRVALARLLMVERPVWLLDEPVNALDAASQLRFAEICQEHRRAGGMIIAASHVDLGLSDATTLTLGANR